MAPQCFQFQNTDVLMPIDPVGQGSWISVNEHGLSLCLLNFYQGKTPTKVLQSRGQLLKSLSHLNNISAVNLHLTSLDLSCFAAFSLVVFETVQQSSSRSSFDVRCFQWNGVRLEILNLTRSMITSSSVKFDHVAPMRAGYYDKLGENPSSNALIDFHFNHQPAKGFESVCMHRDDAKTVSFSHITVSNSNIAFSYLGNSPCKGGKPVDVFIQKNKQYSHTDASESELA